MNAVLEPSRSPPPEAAVTPQELVAKTGDLVSLPEAYLKARRILAEPRFSMRQLADVVSLDPGLTARLLRIVNSAFFGVATRVATVSRALTLLGTQQIHDLILATSVTRAFGQITAKDVDMPSFWRNSVFCGTVARMLADYRGVHDSERLFVAGLLHRVGHLLMYKHIPGLAQQALLASREQDCELFRAERKLIGCDYAQVGAELLASWRLPEGLQEAVRFHPEPKLALEFPREASFVHIAALVTDASFPEPEFEAAPFDVQVAPSAWEQTGLSPAVLPEVVEAAAAQLELAVDLFVS